MAQRTSYKKIPLDDSGKLIEKTFRILSPANLVIISFPKHGKTLAMVNNEKILIGDTATETLDFPFCKNYVRLLTFSGDKEFIPINNGTYIPAGIWQTVDELNKANRMKEYWLKVAKLEERIPDEDKQAILKDVIDHLNGMPFPIFATDTVTTLQDMNYPAALAEYNFRFSKKRTDIRRVDDYGGVQYIRNNFIGIKEFIEKNAAPFKIWTGHVKEKKSVIEKSSEQLAPIDMALDGIQSTTFTARAQAVSIFYRRKDGCYLDFRKRDDKDESDLGARCVHLSNQLIKIAEIQHSVNEPPVTHWDLIYPELNFKK